jgi:hypothetical protein
MKITTTVKENITVDIELPAFFVRKEPFLPSAEYVGILNADTLITLLTLGANYILIRHELPSNNQSKIEEVLKWDKVDEQTFLDTYNGALSCLSLTPTLIEKTESADDLKGLFEGGTGGEAEQQE